MQLNWALCSVEVWNGTGLWDWFYYHLGLYLLNYMMIVMSLRMWKFFNQNYVKGKHMGL